MRLIQFLLLTPSFLFLSATLSAQTFITQRQVALLEKARRPTDPWPRGDGHVLIGEPGSPVSQKAYHEPGGSFTPSPGSFGIAVWVTDADGNLVATSDDIPMKDITQHYQFGSNKVPSISSTTPYYQCDWSLITAGRWKGSFKNISNQHQLWLVFRSVGPAGGPLESAIWDSSRSRLLINHNWIIQPDKAPAMVITGDETSGNILKPIGNQEILYTANGWGFAKLKMTANEFSILLNDSRPQFASSLSYQKTIPQFSFNVPDKDFTNCLNAQISNLMMGYIGRQTGPGEPINYPLAWERDGAYSLLAMARSGQLQTAKELSIHFAENDFFGGFGAEGDAPGSAMNALCELAFILNDPEYDKWVWPHIKRKAAIIDEMMNATTNLYKNYVGPIVPAIQNDLKRRKLIARKTDNGLIDGTMDLHFPTLYINAISYRGLMQASRLATRMNEKEFSRQCIEKGKQLQTAWLNAFGKEKYDNERNFMISIYPSWIIQKDYQPFQEKIEKERNLAWDENGQPRKRPEWTYFTLAEAHQWLYMDQPAKSWQTLRYFWNNQCSPGLYSFWEGYGEENTFKQWDNYRGWLQPKYVTPHYWTASEMTLLQLDMLVYLDDSKNETEIVIGAGVPQEWLTEKIEVKDFQAKAGLISWTYADKKLQVIVKNAPAKYKIRTGVNLKEAIIKVNYK